MEILRTVEAKFNFFPHITHDFFWKTYCTPMACRTHLAAKPCAVANGTISASLTSSTNTTKTDTHTLQKFVRMIHVMHYFLPV